MEQFVHFYQPEYVALAFFGTLFVLLVVGFHKGKMGTWYIIASVVISIAAAVFLPVYCVVLVVSVIIASLLKIFDVLYSM